METADVMGWVREYERAWRDQDVAAVERLFTEDALYLRGAYDEGLRGRAAIAEFWLDPTPFTMSAEPVAVAPPMAVVRVEVQYLGDDPHEFRDLWVMRFAADGRAEHFEEWAHWPGLEYAGPGAD
ncbi:nuclear transport factor 2 family protein [Cellulomonas shaoxiangyii]|uniref:Nuclear transport factor 2 family protein n=1 Tax=Cellulomonas shaoxiangyii TaxID=2566013 RepID=A0A4P7SP69_9CELL|nr:nuclear transport factor 2 family protein [Cellulomonas shaoxiangyii]QCB94483.1 nuclear transport factor 2 family protein [Cellulomonas shaoxiangyii]TGY86065.1 nuclear transport factor 2 family protein [Cellulomonas shaoxiangyii]